MMLVAVIPLFLLVLHICSLSLIPATTLGGNKEAGCRILTL